MQTFVAVAAGLALVAVSVAAVYLILALLQITRTARSVDLLVRNLNRETEKIEKVTGAVSQAAGFVSGFLGRGASSTLGLAGAFARGFFGRGKKSHEEDEQVQDPESSNAR